MSRSFAFAALWLLIGACSHAAPAGQSPRSYETGRYRNLFREIGKSDAEIEAKVETAYRQLFQGDDATQRLYYPVGETMAYIKDVGNMDVRSEGMSYGMMVAVQLGKRGIFDRLWRWSKVHMQHARGPWKGYFAWQCRTDGTKMAEAAASDGEEYFATALYFADGRWGSSQGILNYRKEADAILDAMLAKRPEGVTTMFDLKEKQVVFVPAGTAATFTDPSYHLPAFYELWARWAPRNREFWKEAALVSRKFFRKATHPVTGLAPDYSTFEGKPLRAPWNPDNRADNFQSDAFRVGGNIGMDYAWFGVDPWQVEYGNRLLGFFDSQKPDYVSGYTVDGKPLVPYKSTGLVAMNATASLASDSPVAKRFVRELWDAPIPSGQWRYYDGMLYLFGLLHASGRYRVWTPKTL